MSLMHENTKESFFVQNKLNDIQNIIRSLDAEISELRNENMLLKKQLAGVRSKGILHKTVSFIQNMFSAVPDVEITIDDHEQIQERNEKKSSHHSKAA